MRRVFSGIYVTLFIISGIFLTAGIVNKMQRHRQQSFKMSKLPSFVFLRLNNETFHSSEILNGPVLIIRFHPDCEHCQYEISEILNSNIPATGVKVILVSSSHPDSIQKFIDRFNCPVFPNVIPLADTSDLFGDIFGSDIIPSNFIYDSELNLDKVFYGEVKTATILNCIHRIE